MDEKENQKSRKNGSLFFSIFLPIVLTSALAFGVYQYRDYFKGEAGASGLNGKDGTNGTNGKDGENGKSAYELAVEAGFSGTLEEWLESLKGKDGAPGKDGKDGVNGKDGKDGAPGKDGKDGSNGKTNIEVAVDRLNSMLKTNTSKLTPHERFVEAGITEFNFKNLAHYNNEFYYSLKDKRFIAVDLTNCILTGSTNYAKNSVLPEESNDLFKFSYSLTDISTSYANYLCDFDVEPSDLSKEIPIQTSLDVGQNDEAFKLNYLNHSGVAKEVVIRTNGGALTVNAPLDTVKHYGNADNVNIVAVASASYHENGTVPFIQISRGRIEIEATGDVNGIHVANVQTVGENGEITKTENTFSNDVVLTLNGNNVKLTRDTIGTAIESPVLVCEVQENANSNEFIWLVGDGTIENAKVYVTETKETPNTTVPSTTTTENASAAAIAIANNAVNTGSEENPTYTAIDTGVKLNTSEDQEIWATYDSQAKLEYLINNTVFENLKQTANITDMKSVDIPKNRIICIDMNGYSIDTALQSEGRHYYAFYNYGELTLQDLSEEKTSYIKARGIENLGGKMTINSGTYYNIDTNGGAAVWNENQKIQINGGYIKKSEFDNAKEIFDEEDIAYFNQNFIIEDFDSNYLYQSSGRGFNLTKAGYGWMLIYNKYEKEESVGDLTINGGNFIVEHVGSASDNSGPGCVNSKVGTKLTINGGTFTSSSMRTYTIIADGDTTINDCTVIGAHGALGIDSGTATINGGTFTCTQYYGCWITNDGTDTRVTINGGSFSGKYGIYSSVDDGGQDESNVAITINGGTFEGTSGSAVINTKATQNQFALMIYGGKFSSNPSTYVSTSYTITEDNGWFVVTK